MDDKLKVSKELIEKRNAVLDKTKVDNLLGQWEQDDREQIEAAKKGIFPPTITEPKCKVCTSNWREYIEWCILKNYSDEAIERTIPADSEGKKPSRKSIKNHSVAHMKIEDTIARKEMEEEAHAIGRNVEKGIHQIHTERGILRSLIAKAYSDAQDGLIRVEAKDLIQMMKLQREIEEKSSDIKGDEATLYLKIFLQAIKNVFSSEDMIKLQVEIKRLREEEEIHSDIEGALPVAAIEEATVVEDD